MAEEREDGAADDERAGRREMAAMFGLIGGGAGERSLFDPTGEVDLTDHVLGGISVQIQCQRAER